MSEDLLAEGAAQLPDKMYFRIGEASRLVGVPSYVLRFWETEFPAVSPRKSGRSHRLYRRKDVELILDIKRLLYKERYSIAGAKKKLLKGSKKAAPADDADKDELKKTLTDIKAELLNIKELLD